jgi:uncharacterized membrane protein
MMRKGGGRPATEGHVMRAEPSNRSRAPGSSGRSARSPMPRRHRSPANQVRHDDLSFGPRVADKVPAVFGSWGFILIQSALILLWLAYNGYAAVHYLHSKKFDPYPFILLNLLFSTQAAYAAPLILLSQNRTAERDRVKAEHDFDVNVLALRTLAELLGDVHDPRAQESLLRQIDDLLG